MWCVCVYMVCHWVSIHLKVLDDEYKGKAVDIRSHSLCIDRFSPKSRDPHVACGAHLKLGVLTAQTISTTRFPRYPSETEIWGEEEHADPALQTEFSRWRD